MRDTCYFFRQLQAKTMTKTKNFPFLQFQCYKELESNNIEDKVRLFFSESVFVMQKNRGFAKIFILGLWQKKPMKIETELFPYCTISHKN